MPKFRKKPVVIEACQLPQDDDAQLAYFIKWAVEQRMTGYSKHPEGGILIDTLEGTMRANPGDWIIKGVKGEFYPCKPDIFEETYEAVE